MKNQHFVKYLAYTLLLIPVFAFRDYTPDNELRYISIIDEAIANNSWFAFYNHGIAYADKPPLYFWLMMFSKMIFGGHYIWVLGLFSIVPAVGILAIMDRWVKQAKIATHHLTSNLLTLTTGIFLGGALVLRMDMLMTLFIVLSLYTFYRIYKQTAHSYERWLLPIYIFLAIFSKGAMGLLIPVVSMIAFLGVKRELRQLGRCFGWAQSGVLLALCGAWFSLIYIEGGGDYLNNILFKQTVGRGINSFHHKAPFFYYLKMMWATFAPWSLLYFTAIIIGIKQKLFKNDISKFFATVVISTFVMLSLISSKLDIYLLPIYPFVTYLAVMAMVANKQSIWLKIVGGITCGTFALMLPAAYFFKSLIPFAYESLTLVYVGLGLMTLGGAFGLFWIFSDKLLRGLIFASAGFLTMICVVSFGLPQFNAEIGFARMAEVGRQLAIKNNTTRYGFYKFRSGENMDVFLGEQLTCFDSLPELIAADSSQHTVLFIRNRETRREADFSEWLQTHPQRDSVGDFQVLIIGKR